MNKVNLLLLTTFFIQHLFSSLTFANESVGVDISNAWISEAPPTVSILAAYARIQNNSSDTKTLTSVTSPFFSSIEIHLSKITDGMVSMEKQSSLSISAGSTIELSPGNYHLMLFNPETPLKAGNTATLIFNFSDGTSESVQAPVTKRGNDGHDHHHH